MTAPLWVIAAGIVALAAITGWQAWMRHSDSQLHVLTDADIRAASRPHVDPLTVMPADNGRPPTDDPLYDAIRRELER